MAVALVVAAAQAVEDGRDPIEVASDEWGICRECGEDLTPEQLRWDLAYHPECAGLPEEDEHGQPTAAPEGA